LDKFIRGNWIIKGKSVYKGKNRQKMKNIAYLAILNNKNEILYKLILDRTTKELELQMVIFSSIDQFTVYSTHSSLTP
jgi:hypothetical protein